MDKTYLVINESTSAVAVSTRHESILIEGRRSYPFTIDEIRQINSNSTAFKIGLLFFEKDCEEELYSELKIRDWKSILHNEQIESMLLNATAEDVERILAIDSVAYFERIRGICIMLKNTRKNIPAKIDEMISARWREICSGRKGTSITVSSMKNNTVDAAEFAAYKNDMEKKVADLMAVVENLTSTAEAKNTVKAKEPPVKPVDEADPGDGKVVTNDIPEPPAKSPEAPKKQRSTAKSTKTTK